MKRSDWAAILLIAGLTGVVSYFLLGMILPKPEDNLQSVPIATTFDDKITAPSTKVFNSGSINPTVKVYIGNQSDGSPFNVSSNKKDKNSSSNSSSSSNSTGSSNSGEED